MSDVTILGTSLSSYLRTTRMACEEKGISHDLEDLEFGSDGHAALHPFLAAAQGGDQGAGHEARRHYAL